MAPDGHEAFPLILEEARKKAREQKSRIIVAGLNGHVNYGMGFLANNFHLPQSFGAPYNTPEYIDTLQKNGGVADRQVSFLVDTAKFKQKWLPMLERKGDPGVTCRIANFRKIKEEIRLYTDLNNQIFHDHKLYYKRRYEEDFELFREFSCLLRNENFIVAEDRGHAIGFLLWYPDFNELIKKGSSLGWKTVVKSRLAGNRISRFKIAEIGILPEYQGKNVSWALLKKCSDLTIDRYSSCETSWIFDDNQRSRGLAETWEGAYGESIRLHKQYCVYYFDI
jgi:GNAT superfamily N-acetyltransferase